MEVLLDTCGRRGVRSLLLLFLFVVKAAADCAKPQERENTFLTDEAQLLNHFPEGSDVTLECANGYVVESGSGVISCVDGNWTEPDLICTKKDCGPPEPQPNMHFNLSAGTLYGAVIRATCDKGFLITGSSYKQCYALGWSGKGKCEIVTCDKPREVTNGRSSWDSQDDPKYGESIQYVCNDGFTLTGKDSIMCSDTGEYDSPPPVCEEVSTSTDAPATPTAHRDQSVTTRAPPTSPSVRGGRDSLTAEGKANTTSVTPVTSSSFQDEHDGIVDTNKDAGYMPVIVSVICVSLAMSVVALFLHRYQKRKGSYDTREDLKPELLQFQNL